MKKLYVVIAIVALSLSGCGRISHDIDIIEDRLDKLEQESIPSINEQIASMQLSLTTLERTSEQLDEYIDGLQTTMEILENSINEANRQIKDLESNISLPDIQGQVNAINTSIEALETKDAALETTIENLHTEIDAKDNATKDWAEKTFATLEQYNSVTAEIASIKEQINTIDATISALATQLQDSLADIENSIAALDADLQNVIKEITADYTDAVETAKNEIKQAYETTIKSSIDKLEKSLKDWVGEQLSGYYTISEIDAKLEDIEQKIAAGGDESLVNELTEIKNSLENLKTEVSAVYRKAIEDAINTNNGVIDGKIAEALATINSRIDSEVAALDAKITALQSQVNTNTADIAKLMSRIQSVSYIPIYEDDKATVYFTPGFGSYAPLDFEIKPNDVVDDIAAAYSEICTVKAIYKQTRAVEFIDMPIKECVADTENGVLSLVVSAENLSEEFFAGTQSASLRLSIANESSNIASEYVPVVAKKEPLPNNEIWYTNGSTNEATAPNKTDVFGANIVSNLYDEEKRCWVITFDGDVTMIGERAFYGSNTDCKNITSIAIPDSVTKIGVNAFRSCTSLTSVNIPDSVTEIGSSAFQGCTSLTSVNIPNSVTSIGNHAFYRCTSLISVTIPDSVTSIGFSAFNGCTSLKAFYGKFASEDNRCLIVNGTLNAFAIGCGATSYTIPDSVTEIGYQAFSYCTSLTSVTIPNGVTEIRQEAFSQCESLTNVTIPDSVTSIGDQAFRNCSSLKAFYGKFASEDHRCLIVDGRLISFAIGCGATSYTIPDSVTSIGWYAFYGCTSLTSVTIPDSVTRIGSYAFYYCTSLKEVYCKPTTPPTGGSSMFSNNASDRKIYVPASDDDSIINAYKAKQYWSDYADYIFEMDEEVEPAPANNEIWYTNGSTTKATAPNKTDVFGANIVSNLYDAEKECWVIKFDGDVTSIGKSAFRDCDSLASVTIPDSVTSIGDYAFYYCSSLTNVTIPNSVTSIGRSAFNYCALLTNGTIPNNVTSIGDYAFRGCNSLTTVTIPDGVTTIGQRAFGSCKSLKAFYGKFTSEDNRCLVIDGVLDSFAPAGITSYTIPDGVTSIGEQAFVGSSSLTSVTISNSVASIGESAFSSCHSLTSVTIGDSVISIESGAFSACSSLKTFYGKFASEDNRCLIVDGVLNSFAIGCGATSYTIPDSVTSIGEYVFGLCESLTSVTIPDSVTSIGVSAFSNCTSLKTVYCKRTTPPAGGEYMFSYNASDRKIYVPASADDSIINAYKAAQYWSDYADYIFEEVESAPANNEIWYTNGSTNEATTPYKTDVFGANIVSNLYDAEKKCWVITFDGDVTSIGRSAFYKCTSLTSVTIPDSVTSIGNSAFDSCKSLTSVTIGNGVTSIGYSAFYSCKSLTSVTIGKRVTSIGYDAFSGCSSLISVTIPDSVTSIGRSAFNGCTSLKAFYGKFASEDNRCLIVNGVLNSFAIGCGATSYTIPDGVTSIGDSAFRNCPSLTSITIPNNVTSIESFAFGGCTSLTSITIPDNVTSIGNYAFSGCTSLKAFYGKFASEDNRCLIVNGVLNSFAIGCGATSYTIPDGVTSIGYNAFYYCKSLTSVTIPDSVTRIESQAFYYCTSLTSVTIPDSVTSIGYVAFYGCTSLKEVYCKPTTPPAGGEYMFSNNASDRKIYVPASDDDSIINAYKAKSYWSDYADSIFEYDFSAEQ